jgi:hypothetical protein
VFTGSFYNRLLGVSGNLIAFRRRLSFGLAVLIFVVGGSAVFLDSTLVK